MPHQPRLILGSQSPRRKEILDYFTLPYRQVPSHFDEESIPFEGDPTAYTVLLSQKKGGTLASQFPDELIITADTTVSLGSHIFNKPRDALEAKEMLRELGGRWHEVVTGVSLTRGNHQISAHAVTRLLFHKLSDSEIDKFHAACPFLDKAGGYAIEKGGSLIVDKMEGCFYNVMGLPVRELHALLLTENIDLWDYLQPY